MANAPPRSIPVLHLDYSFLWKDADEGKQIALVGKIEPTGSTLVVPMDVKGPTDQYGCEKLKSFIKTHRTELLVCKSDQEHALVAQIEKIVDTLRRDGVQVALEQSPVGESQSNGIAARKIQAVEDPLRTMRAALQGRLKMQIPMRHPIMQWVMENVGSVMNHYVMGNDGLTAYQRLHGRRADSKAVEFGEHVFYHVPKKLRSKMQLRWRIGIYMGVAGHPG